MNELVIIDIDNTLVNGQSQNILLNYLYSKKLVGIFYFTRIYLWFVLYKMGMMKNPKQVLEYAIKFLGGKQTLDIEAFIKEFVNVELRPFFFKEMLEIIHTHKTTGRKVILVSNTIDILAKKIADFVSADDYIASKLEIKDNVYTGRVIGPLVYGDNKYTVVQDYMDTHTDFSFENSWAYADHRTDEKLLLSVKYPYAVNPDNKLEKIALSNRWPILRFNLPQ